MSNPERRRREYDHNKLHGWMKKLHDRPGDFSLEISNLSNESETPNWCFRVVHHPAHRSHSRLVCTQSNFPTVSRALQALKDKLEHIAERSTSAFKGHHLMMFESFCRKRAGEKHISMRIEGQPEERLSILLEHAYAVVAHYPTSISLEVICINGSYSFEIRHEHIETPETGLTVLSVPIVTSGPYTTFDRVWTELRDWLSYCVTQRGSRLHGAMIRYTMSLIGPYANTRLPLVPLST